MIYHMRKTPKHIFLLSAAVLSLLLPYSCSEGELYRREYKVTVNGREFPASAFRSGQARIKVTEDLASSIQGSLDEEGAAVLTGVKSLDDALASIGTVRIERAVPEAGIYEPLHRRWGLHLWMNVYFDDSLPLTKAGEALSEAEGIVYVEYIPETILLWDGQVTPVDTPAAAPASETPENPVFDDPMLYSDQWHYYNDGSGSRTLAGSDADVLPVWSSGMVGSSDVIVAVVDGGIDIDHEDLSSNIWQNPNAAEGYPHGFNFVRNNGEIVAHSHGTHVAGTVAAVNNNGIGVCGIAGGDLKAGIPGVRLMSCQIFETGEDGKDVSGPGSDAIIWASDHGAVIAQNSWGYSYETLDDALAGYVPEYDKIAIDYFTANAGYDENGREGGNQTGPMAGGLVIFSAGNDAWPVGYPGNYETAVAVSSVGADYQPAYYTNYGDWVDITAPGGDVQKNYQVMSTLPDNQYGLMQGTSMACPHVSGVAALLVSEFGGPGFTNTELRRLLEEGARDISEYYSGEKFLGRGLLDARRSFSLRSGEAPEAVATEGLIPDVIANNILFNVSVPADPDDGCAYFIRMRCTPAGGGESVYEDTAVPHYMKAGDIINVSAHGLEFSTEYTVTLSALDLAGNESAVSEAIAVSTEPNNAPVIEPKTTGDTVINLYQTVRLDFGIREPDWHAFDVSMQDVQGMSLSKLNDTTWRVTMYGERLGIGEHEAVITAEDEYGLSSRFTVRCIVKDNSAPVAVRTINDTVINATGSGQPVLELNLGVYFSDPDSDALSYSVSYSDNNVAGGSVSNGILSLTPVVYGLVDITVVAQDPLGEKASQTFTLLIRDGSRPTDFYPNPVADTLYVRTGEPEEDVTVMIRAANGAVVLSQSGCVSPFAPLTVDMSALPGGIYSVTASINDTEHTQTIAKL